MPNGVISHSLNGEFDIPALLTKAQKWAGLIGADLAATVSTDQAYEWDESRWVWPDGHGSAKTAPKHVAVIDYGVKRNILRSLAAAGIKSTVVPATMSAKDILTKNPDGIVLSNGPGDPQATGEYAIPVILDLIKSGLPVFGICLGHQMLALATWRKNNKNAPRASRGQSSRKRF